MKHLKLLYLASIQYFLFPIILFAQQGQMDWTLTTDSAGWSGREMHSSVVFNNKIWVLGGLGRYDREQRDVWYSTDGINWVCATATAGWSARCDHSSVVFDNKIWVLGGIDSTNTYRNDVWYSTDGINWVMTTNSAPWDARVNFSVVVFDNKMWVMGGYRFYGHNYNDVWYSTDGVNWSLATDSAGWSKRSGHTSVVFDNKMWVLGGQDANFNYKNDVWFSSNGITWTQATANAGWPARRTSTSVIYDNKIWLIGGSFGYQSFRNDVWYSSDGISWTCATISPGWTARYGHTSVVFNNKMWLIGGYDGGNSYCNDIWYSIGHRITLIYPNGGEYWTGGNNYTIRWRSSDTGLISYRILLSRNNGFQYRETIAYNVAVTETTFNWITPLENNIAYRIMIQTLNAYGQVLVQDQSDSPFQIQTIMVLSPNGGEVFAGGSNYIIRWRSLFHNFARYRILFVDDGNVVDTIARNVAMTETTYNWTTPTINSANCQILIQMLNSADSVLCQDLSNGIFTIHTLSVVSPNGGEVWNSGSYQTIKWRTTSHSNFSSYRLILFRDGGYMFQDTLMSNIPPADSFYFWYVIPIHSTACIMHVQALDAMGQVICEDASDEFFTIRTQATIISPNGSENYLGGEHQFIRWRTEGSGFNSYRILFSQNSGASYPETIAHHIAPTETSYYWTVPPVNSNCCRVMIQILNAINWIVSATASNSDFTIQTVILIAPNGYETWSAGSHQLIKWRTTTSINCARFRLIISRNGGTTYTDTIANNIQPTESTFLWLTPVINVTTCRIKVQALDTLNNILCEDASNGNFAIQIFPTIIAPNGGEQWLDGTYQTIKWRTVGAGFARYRILLSQNGGSTYPDTIAQNISAIETTYLWHTPRINITTCRIKIQILDAASNLISEDASNGNFTIQALFMILPNGGEVWPSGSNQTIKWQTATYVILTYFRILLSKNDGNTYTDTIAFNVAPTESTYLWLTLTINVTTCRVKVQALDNSGNIICEDASNGNFTIRTLTTVMSPNGGETWLGRTNQIIKWQTTGAGFQRYRILFSQNGGSSYLDTIAHNIPPTESTYLWITPLINNTTCRVKVQILDASGNLISEDVSNGNFTIQTVIVISPNGGEIWPGGSNQFVKWRASSNDFDRFQLLLSRNSGSTYTDTIIQNILPTESTYLWLTPTINVTTCRLKVQILDSLNNVIGQDASNSNFTIHTITLVSPNGGENWQGGRSQIIKWRTTIGLSFARFRILFSSDTGNTYSDTIVHNITTSETLYNWLVPALNYNTCRVMVQILDGSDNVICEDASNSNFTIDSDPPSLFNLSLPQNNAWTNASPRFIWQRAIDNFAMSYYQLSISIPGETLKINTSDTINPIPSPGSTWQQATSSSEWTNRLYHTSVVFNNKIWVIGGYDGSYLNDVWYSSNGVNWTQATANAGWSARSGHTSVVFDNKIWVIGGYDGSYRNDVWSSVDGLNWTCVTANAGWSPRFAHTSIVFDNKIWVLGGSNRNDVWYSADGVNWTCATASAGWSPRENHTSLVFDNKMWVLGGSNQNDVWYSVDGINWTCATNSAWFYGGRYGHTSVVFDDKMWVIGGAYPSSVVWYSTNGADWNEATGWAEWHTRSNHTSVVFRGMMWVIGGYDRDNNINRNDVWYSVAPPMLPEGIQTWWVIAFDRAGNSRQSNQTFLIRVDTTPPLTPVLVSPVNGAFLPNPIVTFIWQHTIDNLSGLKEYHIQVANNTNFINSINTTTPDTSITITLSDTTNWWRVRAVDSVNNQSEWSNIRSVTVNLGVEEQQESFAMNRLSFKVYPNPAKLLTTIRYSLPAESKISLQLYDISGRLVKTLVDEKKKSGIYNINFNSKTLSAGVYFLSLQTNSKRLIERLVVVK